MMRNILFRGKRLDNREWAYGDLLRTKSYLNESVSYYIFTDAEEYPRNEFLNYSEVDLSTIGEYTGLSDRNVLEIFEGDCIKIPDSGDTGFIRYGKYIQPCEEDVGGHIGFFVDWMAGENKDFLRKDLGYWAEWIDIIGNIYDNPDILKEGA